MNNLSELQKKISYDFKDPSILIQAVTHKSYANEKGGVDNERLEFLGDAVLALTVSNYMLKRFPELAEGDLSRLRAFAVNENTLSKVAGELCLGDYLLLGRGEELSGGRKKDSILADALEALIAAIFIDGGIESASAFVITNFTGVIEDLYYRGLSYDFKTELQEFCQGRFGMLPVYRVSGEYGPDHEKVFEITLIIAGEVYGSGSGRSKKEAEQAAAAEALARLRGEAGFKESRIQGVE